MNKKMQTHAQNYLGIINTEKLTLNIGGIHMLFKIEVHLSSSKVSFDLNKTSQ
jgi:hypothetical protein